MAALGITLAFLRRLESVAPALSQKLIGLLAHSQTEQAWQRLEWASQHPEQAQEKTLAEILAKNAGTAFAVEHRLGPADDLATFRSKVPIRDYNGHATYIDRAFKGESNVLASGRPVMFAISSGTTGAEKYIPRTSMQELLSPAWAPVYVRRIAELLPDALLGFSLELTSRDPRRYSPGGTLMGAAPVVTAGGWFDNVAPFETYYIEDADLRYYTLLRLGAQYDVRVLRTLNPSTGIVLAKKLAQFRDQLVADLRSGAAWRSDELPAPLRAAIQPRFRPAREAAARLASTSGDTPLMRLLWPKLRCVLCWLGGSSSLYRNQMQQYYGDVACWDPGYRAVEAFFAFALEPESTSCVPDLLSNVLEFIPEDDIELERPATLGAHQLEKGQRYKVVVTTRAGLCRYDMSDMVECNGYFNRIATITFRQRGSATISFTGEKVTESQAIQVMERLEREHNFRIDYGAVTAEFGDPPRYILALEAVLSETQMRAVERAFDLILCETNVEYQRKRKTQRLAEPKLRLLPPGTRDKLYAMRNAQGARDGRIKLPALYRDPETLYSAAKLT